MLSLAIAVVAIALPDCINPSLIAGELLVASGQHPGARAIAFTLSAWTVTFVVGLVLALGLGDLILSILPKPGATLKYSLITAAGILLVAGGTAVWIRRKALAGSAPAEDAPRKSHGSAVLLGAGIAGIELVTALPYFGAIAMIVGSSASVPGKVSLLVLYCFIYTLPLIAIAVVCVVKGQRATQVLRPTVGWLLARWPAVVGPLGAAFGLALAAYGIIRLSST